MKVRQELISSLRSIPDYASREVVEQSKLVPTAGTTDIQRFAKRTGMASMDLVASCSYLANLRKSAVWGTRVEQSERLELDLVVSKNGESYREVQNRGPGNIDPAHSPAASAATSQSMFLRTIFLTDAASFTYRGPTTMEGRALLEFGYSVPAEKSAYSIATRLRRLGSDTFKTYSGVVSYDGSFLVDPQTLDPIRIVVHADQIPAQLKLCETTTTLDYARIPLNGSRYLLLGNAVTRDENDDGTDDVYTMKFSNFHEFQTSSSVVFGPPVTGPSSPVPGPSARPSALSSSEERQLADVRRKVIATIDRLPNYLCSETIDRMTLEPEDTINKRSTCEDLAGLRRGAKWKLYKDHSDRLRLDVATSRDGHEMYSWAGDTSRFQGRTLADLAGSGATTTGAFRDWLRAIFETDAVRFTYDGERRGDDRPAIQFSFSVPSSNSSLIIRNQTYDAHVGYHGQLLVEPTTSDLARLSVWPDELPEQLHACSEINIFNFTNTRLNGAQFLLPQTTILNVAADNGTQYENKTLFSSCREFSAQSSLTFNSNENPASKNERKDKPEHAEIPPGLHFTLRFSTQIDTATAAAGDEISGTLTSPIRNGKTILEPKGATVTGRIVKLERQYQPPSWTIIVHLESIQNDGASEPFHAQLSSAVKQASDNGRHLKSIEDNQLGPLYQMPNADDQGSGVLRFEGFTGDYVVPKGLYLEAITIEH